jgi:4-hydroxybenzoate polyprenyltransferase
VPRPAPAAAEESGRLASRLWLRFVADLIGLARPLHAAKSVLLVPLALVAAPGWTAPAVIGVGWAVLAFVLAGAAVYVANDVSDRRRDERHPAKRGRPIAAGRITPLAGGLYCAVLLSLLALLIAAAPGGPYWPVLAYLALNAVYNRVLKHIPLIDVGVVAFGLVLRVVQGYVTTGARISTWLVVAVFSLALLVLIGKRRDELLQAGAGHRPALRGYSLELTNQLLPLTGVLGVVAGLIFLSTEAPFSAGGTAAMLLSTPLALFCLARYLQLMLVYGRGGDPVRALLRDRALLATGALWGAALGATLLIVHNPGLARAMEALVR